MSKEQEVIKLLVYYMDGVLTEFELIGQLFDLGPEIDDYIPDSLPCWPPRKGLKEKIKELRNVKPDELIRIKSYC